MLGSFSEREQTASSAEGMDALASQVAAGVAAELRAEITAIPEKIRADELNRIVEGLRDGIDGQLRVFAAGAQPSHALESVLRRVNQMSPEARALASALEPCHLGRKQYLQLSRGPLKSALNELRRLGILVPVMAADGSPVYYYPSGRHIEVRAALRLLAPVDKEVHDQVKAQLDQIGYTGNDTE